MASCQLVSCLSSRQETDQVTQQWASRHRESLVVESRDSSSSRQEAGQLARRRIGLPIVASGCSSSRRVTLRVAWRCSSAQMETRRGCSSLRTAPRKLVIASGCVSRADRRITGKTASLRQESSRQTVRHRGDSDFVVEHQQAAHRATSLCVKGPLSVTS